MTSTRHALTRSRLPIAIAARAGVTRTADQERASYARCALRAGFRTVAAVANFVRSGAPEVGCDEAEAVVALRTVARTTTEERDLALEVLRRAGALPVA